MLWSHSCVCISLTCSYLKSPTTRPFPCEWSLLSWTPLVLRYRSIHFDTPLPPPLLWHWIWVQVYWWLFSTRKYSQVCYFLFLQRGICCNNNNQETDNSFPKNALRRRGGNSVLMFSHQQINNQVIFVPQKHMPLRLSLYSSKKYTLHILHVKLLWPSNWGNFCQYG